MSKSFEQEILLNHIDELNNRISRTYSFVGEFNPCNKTEYVEKARAFEIVKYNLKKRVPIRPISKDKISTFHPLHCICQICPSCGNELIHPELENYCVKCGQAIEWDEMEE